MNNRVSTQDLVTLNPHIEHPDQVIAGKQVVLPFTAEPDRPFNPFMKSNNSIPFCPIGPNPILNSWIPLTPIEQMSRTEYDVLIVGSGAGGGAVLWRLCEQWKEQGKRIGIIERGNQVLQMHARNLPTMNQERLTEYFNYISRPLPGATPEYPDARQVFALGGRTLFWYAFTPRMHEWDLVKWPVPVDELESYYGIAEQVVHIHRILRNWLFTYGKIASAALDARLFQSVAASSRGRYRKQSSDGFIPTCLPVPFR